ncbi:MAG: hypothetical protein NUV91_04330 [Candidatus Omnitrophica bacterium]|nr:hypothetical protein [Candidatus Omnitrophota bacterium]
MKMIRRVALYLVVFGIWLGAAAPSHSEGPGNVRARIVQVRAAPFIFNPVLETHAKIRVSCSVLDKSVLKLLINDRQIGGSVTLWPESEDVVSFVVPATHPLRRGDTVKAVLTYWSQPQAAGERRELMSNQVIVGEVHPPVEIINAEDEFWGG